MQDKNYDIYFDIYYFEYVDKRTVAYLKEDVYQVQESLAKLEVELAGKGFVRINKTKIAYIYILKEFICCIMTHIVDI